MQGNLLVAGLAALTLVVAGCAGPTGTVAFYVKDATIDDFRHLNLTITQVTVHKAGGADDGKTKAGDVETGTSPDLRPEDVQTNESAKPDKSWIVLFEGTHRVDLLQFTGTAKDFVGGADIPPGKYTQIRLALSNVEGTLKDGTVVDIDYKAKGLKIISPWRVDANTNTTLVLDFDLTKSLVKEGKDGTYKLHPTLKLLKEKKAKNNA